MKGGGGGGTGAAGLPAHHQKRDPDEYKKKQNGLGLAARRLISWDHLLMGLGRTPTATAPGLPSPHSAPPPGWALLLFLRRAMLCAALLLCAAYAVYFLQAALPMYCRHYQPHLRDQAAPEEGTGIPYDAVVHATAVDLGATTSANDSSIPSPTPLRLQHPPATTTRSSPPPPRPPPPPAAAREAATSLRHVVFGIAASAKLWEKRKEYIKVWWRPREMQGSVWLDGPVKTRRGEQALLPRIRISADTSKFPYTHRGGHRSAIRISRIVSEAVRELPARDEARWLVMGDDDTVFIPDNLLRVLSKYDHRQPYYIGAVSESHLQNIYFSYAMAYGGGGFAVSRPLAEALARVQDRCLARYPALYGSDDRMQACMAELGVPLTREPGFHQYDVYGNLLGLLAAHPVAPLVSLHHLDVVEPVLPGETRVAALQKLFEGPVRLDSAGVMQQSICYDVSAAAGGRKWTVSVSWGYAVQVVRGVMSPREVEMPTRTFLNWYRRADYTAYAFNTRPVARNPCQKPFVFYLASASTAANGTRRGATPTTVTRYARHRGEAAHPPCKWKMEEPSKVERVVVYKRPDPLLWNRAPRRNCCRVRPRKAGDQTMTIEVGLCRDGEISEPQQA